MIALSYEVNFCFSKHLPKLIFFRNQRLHSNNHFNYLPVQKFFSFIHFMLCSSGLLLSKKISNIVSETKNHKIEPLQVNPYILGLLNLFIYLDSLRIVPLPVEKNFGYNYLFFRPLT